MKMQRVLATHSAREIADKKQAIDSELRACLYLYNNEKFIICAIAGIREHGDPIVLDTSATDNDLGLALCDKLLEFEPSQVAASSDSKLDTWSAYKVSGAKTGKAFEQKCTYVYARTVKSAINIEAAPRVSLENQLCAQCSISNSRSHSDIGAAIRKAIKASGVLRDAGML